MISAFTQIAADGEPHDGAETDADPGSAEPPQPEPLGPGDGPDNPSALSIELNLMVPDADPPLGGWLEVQLSRIAELAGVSAGLVSVAVVDDDQMADLHQQYRQTPGTTDVLSFDLRPQADAPLEAELVVCLDEARRQAERRGHDARLEALLYAVHGLLHMIGYDDVTADEAARMHEREDELLGAAGFGPVFARNEQNE